MRFQPERRSLSPAAAGPPAATGAVVRSLVELARDRRACVLGVLDEALGDSVAQRLRDLGFVAGEEVRVLAHGPIGREPVLVQVGFTRFALRHHEARRVQVAELG